MSQPVRAAILIVAMVLAVAACGGQTSSSADMPTSDFQAKILADSKVDFSEYESAILAAMSCVESEGFETRGPFESLGGRGLGFDAVVPDSAQVEYDRVLDDCEQEYLYPLVYVYNEQIAPSEADIQRGDEIVLECVRALGYDAVDSQDAYRRILEDLGALGGCFDERDAYLYP
jgi:hypothetical protein